MNACGGIVGCSVRQSSVECNKYLKETTMPQWWCLLAVATSGYCYCLSGGCRDHCEVRKQRKMKMPTRMMRMIRARSELKNRISGYNRRCCQTELSLVELSWLRQTPVDDDVVHLVVPTWWQGLPHNDSVSVCPMETHHRTTLYMNVLWSLKLDVTLTVNKAIFLPTHYEIPRHIANLISISMHGTACFS